MENIAIITGGSKGIGKQLVSVYLKVGYQVYTISRTSNLTSKNFIPIISDLSNTEKSTAAIVSILDKISLFRLKNIVLINNAGALGTLSNLENHSNISIRDTIHINLTSPLILSSFFIKKLSKTSCFKRIINISSGAATKIYEGWSTYCASKAGLDSFTKIIASEQQSAKNPVKVTAIYPGVVETDMQKKIRNTSKNDFKNVDRFIALRSEKKLYSPEFTAKKIFELDTGGQLKDGEIVDLRNM